MIHAVTFLSIRCDRCDLPIEIDEGDTAWFEHVGDFQGYQPEWAIGDDGSYVCGDCTGDRLTDRPHRRAEPESLPLFTPGPTANQQIPSGGST